MMQGNPAMFTAFAALDATPAGLRDIGVLWHQGPCFDQRRWRLLIMRRGTIRQLAIGNTGVRAGPPAQRRM